jgi:DNA (cytosine-5)-methyltransferase 1
LTKERSWRPRISAIDLFCGAGGLTHGLARAGIEVVAGVDIDPACKYPYESNNTARFIERDVNELAPSDIADVLGTADLTMIAGCAPCQPYSTYSRPARSKKRENDWQLVDAFGSLVKEVQPSFVTMENVPQLVDHSVFQQLLHNLESYSVVWSIVQAVRIGIPQTRKRLVLVGSKLGAAGLELAQEGGNGDDSPKRHRTPSPNCCGRSRSARSTTCRRTAQRHKSSKNTSLQARRILAGTGRKTCRPLATGRARGVTYPSVYGRMSWDEASPTITTQCFGYGNGRFGHPEQGPRNLAA